MNVRSHLLETIGVFLGHGLVYIMFVYALADFSYGITPDKMDALKQITNKNNNARIKMN